MQLWVHTLPSRRDFHPGTVCVKAIGGTISPKGFDEMEKEPHKYFFRRCYLGFETGSSICCSASCVQDAIKDAQYLIDTSDGVYHYINVYEDGKFIGRCTKDGFISER